ncbi:hypothetical protein [Mesorhizobium sp.]|uniref:hypothetical protein n=1 Tax=Mesorhizobium sp. TaxID=1871066 RepID=UPI00257B32FC|nr:hypothetical protein [Mesorhizobium sp.]
MTSAEKCSGSERRLHRQRRWLPSTMTGYATMTASQKCGEHFDICDAIQREKSLKRWPWKIETSPEWFELFRGTGVVGVRFWSAAFFGLSNGMDPRVCAASLRSLLRPRMTK